MSFECPPKQMKLELDSSQCQNVLSSATGSTSLTNQSTSNLSSDGACSGNSPAEYEPAGEISSSESEVTDTQVSSSDDCQYSYDDLQGSDGESPYNRQWLGPYLNMSFFSFCFLGGNDDNTTDTSSDSSIAHDPNMSDFSSGSLGDDETRHLDQIEAEFVESQKLNYQSKISNTAETWPDDDDDMSGFGLGDDETKRLDQIEAEFTESQKSNSQCKINDTTESWPDDMPDFGIGEIGDDETKHLDQIEAQFVASQKCHVHRVPDHALETIFGHLSLPCLLLKASLVCRRWNDIIQNDKFLSWKKKYYKLKTYPKPIGRKTLRQLQVYVQPRKMNTLDKFLLGLVRDAKIFEKYSTEDMVSFLHSHAKFDGAKHIVETVYPKEKDSNGYAFVIALAIISETVSDVYEILKLLIRPKSSCNIIVLLECLYYLATMLSYVMIQFKAAKGLHYRIFCSLHQYESQFFGLSEDMAITRQGGAQQSINRYTESKMRLTNQQMKIIAHQLDEGHVVKIIAFAGAGKTSTLVEYTKARLNQRFLLINFNKSVSNNANKIFPGNVECRTAHSLAYAAVDVKRVYRYTRNSMKPRHLDKVNLTGPNNFIDEKGPNWSELSQYREAVLNTLVNFCNSADQKISLEHVPYWAFLSTMDRMLVTRDATMVWKKMINPKDFTVMMVHDGYLKLHQLQKPVYAGYNAIIIDEVQDFNPAMMKIILSQKVPKIFVGDPNQQIYSFRGAVNTLQTIKHTHIFYLTESFRFGPDIAYVANTILYELKNIRSQTLVGNTSQSFISTGKLAILGRSNASLFTEAIRMICLKELQPGEPLNVRGCFDGGTAGFKQLIDIYHLKLSEEIINDKPPIEDEFIANFKFFDKLKSFAIATENLDLQRKIELVSKYDHLIPQYVDQVCSLCTYSLDDANVIFSTVHKAKGMEFDTVMLTDDFSVLGFPYKNMPAFHETNLEQEAEVNILYVAVTRAKKRLILNPAVYFVMLGAGERFDYPIYHTEVIAKECSNCRLTLSEGQKFILVKRELKLSNGSLAMVGGPQCQLCSSPAEFRERNIRHPDINNPSESIITRISGVNRTLFWNLLYPSGF